MEPFADRLINAVRAKGTPCIVGLDPAIERMPREFLAENGFSDAATLRQRADLLFLYNKLVLDQVHDVTPAVKPQSAYYERYGSAGFEALERTVEYAKGRGLLVIFDGKRGDIGSTSAAYAEAYLAPDPPRPFEADAMTLHPYMGRDSLEPFAELARRHGKGLFVCVLNSNPGAIALQTLPVEGRPLYEVVADMIRPWTESPLGTHGYGGVGAVVGASSVECARAMRALLPKCFFLVPGLGAQGGSLESVRACFNADGFGALVSSSRSVMYPRSEPGRPLGEGIRRAFLNNVREVRECLASNR